MYSWRGTWRGRWLNEAWGNCPGGEQHGKGGLWLKKLSLKNSKMKIICVKKALLWREKNRMSKVCDGNSKTKIWTKLKNLGVLQTHLYFLYIHNHSY